jgi:hypothetical protein
LGKTLRERIFEKANANKQRRRREELLRALPGHLSGRLAEAGAVYTPDAHSLLQRFLPATRSGIGHPDAVMPAGYWFQEVAREEEVPALLPHALAWTSQSAYLVLHPPSVVSFQDRRYLVPHTPAFVVNAHWAWDHLRELRSFTRRFIALVATDLLSGVVVDDYLGILPDDPNPSEIVYEVAVWPYSGAEPGEAVG